MPVDLDAASVEESAEAEGVDALAGTGPAGPAGDAPVGRSGPLADASLTDIVIAGAATFLLIAYWPGLYRSSPVLLPLVALPLGMVGLVGLVVLVRRGDAPARWAAGYLGWAAIATAFSAQPRLSFDAGYGADRGWLYLAAFVGCWAVARRRGAVGARLALGGILIGLLLNALLAFGQVWSDGSGVFGLFDGRATGFTLNPVFLGALMSGALALTAALLAGGGDRWWAWLGPVCLAATVTNMTGSRVAIAGGVVLAIAAVRRAGVVRIAAVVAALAIGLLLGAQLLDNPSTTRINPVGEGGSGGLSPRLKIWEAGVDAVLERPLVGWGPNRFRPATNQAMDLELTLAESPERLFFDAHNLFVEQLVTLGIPGLILVTGFGIAAARRARGPLAWYAAGVTITWLLEPAAVSTAPTAMLALGFACIPGGADAVPDPPPGRRDARIGLRAIAAVLALLAAMSAARSVYVDYLIAGRGEDVEVLADYRRARDLMPRDPVVGDLYANALLVWARYDPDPAIKAEALAESERNAMLDPTLSGGWNVLGVARLRYARGTREERLASAREAFEQALTLSPWSTTAMAGLFQVSLEEGRPDEARDWLVAMCAAERCPSIAG